tara:strand:+ start:211 stop:390 length:180 start_codon:yes stop_codon:yes gene_type:complete
MQKVIQVYLDSDYETYDHIQIPVLFYLTDEGKRVYDTETMKTILKDQISSIEEHEKHYN